MESSPMVMIRIKPMGRKSTGTQSNVGMETLRFQYNVPIHWKYFNKHKKVALRLGRLAKIKDLFSPLPES